MQISSKYLKTCALSLSLWAVGLPAAQADQAQPLRLDPERMLDGIAMVESSGGKHLVGDGGKSLGVHQISREAWSDVNAARQRAGLQIFSYERSVFNPIINRAYARDFLTILEDRLIEATGRTPSVEQVYASFNMGFERFSQLGFNLNRVNPVTRRNSTAVRRSYDRKSLQFPPFDKPMFAAVQ